VAIRNPELMRETARIYAKHNGSSVEGARELGIPRTTFASRVETAKINGYIRESVIAVHEATDQEIKRIYIKPHYKIFTRPKGDNVSEKILAIGDCHDSTEIPDKSRFYSMGVYAREKKVTQVIQIGDFVSMDSMSAHDPNWTVKGHSKPSFKDDVASFREALSAFNDGLAGYEVTKHVTLGNHEDRIARFVNNNPELVELLYEEIYRLLDENGWSYSPYGEFHFVGEVGFTHVPLNQMGRPYGGVNADGTIAKDSLHDIVYGHSHKRSDRTFPKLGHNYITIINLGCSLPEGYLEDYAKHSVTGWSYGVYDITIESGRIKEQSWVPMDTLIKEYSE
tara:strand:+ start:743 stop:1753 length:1011 start_codon:yes stop_codon:yes gene_type:complete